MRGAPEMPKCPPLVPEINEFCESITGSWLRSAVRAIQSDLGPNPCHRFNVSAKMCAGLELEPAGFTDKFNFKCFACKIQEGL